MSGIAVVASAQDAKFADDVRAGLQSAGLDAVVFPSLPQGTDNNVVLIWSAALEAAHSIDAPTLIGLWSEDRLVTVRRDPTPLPLGLRDLPSLPPSTTVAEICAAAAARRAIESPLAGDEIEKVSVGAMLAGAARAEGTTRIGSTGTQEVELEFWRAIKDGNDPGDFELYLQQFPTGIYAALARRKIARLGGSAPASPGEEKREIEEAARRETEARRRLSREKAGFEAQLATREAEYAKREAELKKKLDEAPRTKPRLGVIASVLLFIATIAGGSWYYFNKASLEKQAALTAALEQASTAAEELKAAQVRQQAALKKLEEERAAEVEAIKAGDQAKVKEAQEAARRAEAEASKQAELVRAREAAAAEARKKAQEGARSAKSAAVAKSPEVTVATAPAPQAAPIPVEAPKAEVTKSEPAPVAAAKAPEPGAKSAEARKPMTRSEREREEEERLGRVAAAKPATQVAASAPSTAPAPTPAASGPPQQSAELLQQAQAMEASDSRGAVKIYRSLARNGNGAAAKRLGEIYDKGIPGISRDYAESLQWYETARKLGESVEMAGRRDGPAPPVRPAPPSTSAAKPAPMPEPVKKAEPAPAPVAAAAPEAPKAAAPASAPEPTKSVSPPPAPEPESKPGWFPARGIWIPLLVLAFIIWRRTRRRQKKAARREQRSLDAAANTASPAMFSRSRPENAQGEVAPLVARQTDGTLFVSYSHKDRPRVEPIVTVIEEMGRRVWMDRSDITGKTGWAGQIVRAIRECHAVVLMASPNSYSSDQVVRELYLAMNHKKTIVPIEIEPAEMPDELQYILAPFHHHRLSGGEPRQVIGRALAAV